MRNLGMLFCVLSLAWAAGPAQAKPAASAGCSFSASMADKPGDDAPKRFAPSTYGEKLEYKGLELHVKKASGGLNVAIKYPDGSRAQIDSGARLHLMQFVSLGGDGKEQINFELDCQ